jgi:uncharacterized membrane protein YgcG
MTGSGRRFDVSELQTTGVTGEPSATDAELAQALGLARDLEAMAAADLASPTDGFEDRVMAAIATEPAPRLAVRPPAGVRGGRLGAMAVAIRESWGVAFSGGRPLAVRAQAMAVVLVAILAAGLLATAGVVTVGGLLQGRPSPVPSVAPLPSAVPSPTMPATALPSPSPSATPEATETPEPVETPRPAPTSGAPGAGGPGTRTPEPEHTAEPTGTDDHGGGGGPGSGGNDGPGGSGGGGGPGPG